MLPRLDLRGRAPTTDRLDALLAPPQAGDGPPTEAVRQLLDDVRSGGDAAVRRLTQRFDGVDVADATVSETELDNAWGALSVDAREAMTTAHRRVTDYHQLELPQPVSYQADGVSVHSRVVPVDRAGLYIPGGRAAYPSSVLMTAVPAKAAGVENVVLCSPPGPDGKVNPAVLAAARLCGVQQVYAIGGVQAVAAMAYGTETVPAVDVIAGPGNAWVSTAQREVAASGTVAVATAHAGPSEIAVIADDSCPASAAAIDLVLQAEHGPDGRAWLITTSEQLAADTDQAIGRVLDASPRADLTRTTLATGGGAVLVDTLDDAVAVANQLAPEHLQLMCDGAEQLANQVRNAGAVFIGTYSPASLGDYVAGPSHVLPTGRSARFTGALGAEHFTKRMAVVTASEAGLGRLGPAVTALAELEGLWAHAASTSQRDRWAPCASAAEPTAQ